MIVESLFVLNNYYACYFAENVDNSRSFLVTSKTCYNEHEEKHLFLTVGDEYILEANYSGKVKIFCYVYLKYIPKR